MASRQVLIILAVAAAALLPATISAVDYKVGDAGGWTLNYTIGWPEGKTFKVGDNLVFTYPSGRHTVVEVDGETFKDCYRQGNALATWTTGNDTVKLDKPGRRWFFCGIADHCEMGLKLVIQIAGNGTDAPPPPTAPAPPAPSQPTPAPPNNVPPAPAAPQSSSAPLKHRVVGEAAVPAIVAAVVAAVLM